jgi:hypothetical protein
MRYTLVLFLVFVSLPLVLFADVVTPTDDVVTRVIVHETPSGQSAQVGSLTPGQQAELIGSVPNWYEVQLANGPTGFVPKTMDAGHSCWTTAASSTANADVHY